MTNRRIRSRAAFLLAAGLLSGAAVIGATGAGASADKVTICHAAGLDGTTHYVTLNISHNAVYGPGGHFNENGTPQAGHEDDYLGPCLDGETTTTVDGSTTTVTVDDTTTSTTEAPTTTTESETTTTVETSTTVPVSTTVTEAPTTTVPEPEIGEPVTVTNQRHGAAVPVPAEVPFTG